MADGKIIGENFPDGLKSTTLRRYYEELGGSGDKKLIYRTDVIKKYPKYPIFEGENYVGLTYLYNMIDDDYELLEQRSLRNCGVPIGWILLRNVDSILE